MNIRKATDSDFEQIIDMFMEFAEFENLPEKMLNTTERMRAEKEFFNCWVAEATQAKSANCFPIHLSVSDYNIPDVCNKTYTLS